MQTNIDTNNHDIINFSKLNDLETIINKFSLIERKLNTLNSLERIFEGRVFNGLFKDTSNNPINDTLNNTKINKVILINKGQTRRINTIIRIVQRRLNPTLTIPNVTLNVNNEQIEKSINLIIVDLQVIRFTDSISGSNTLSINNVDFKIYYNFL